MRSCRRGQVLSERYVYIHRKEILVSFHRILCKKHLDIRFDFILVDSHVENIILQVDSEERVSENFTLLRTETYTDSLQQVLFHRSAFDDTAVPLVVCVGRHSAINFLNHFLLFPRLPRISLLGFSVSSVSCVVPSSPCSVPWCS